MATVVSITNPITGAVEQVDKLDHTAQQIDDAVALSPQLSNPNLLDNWYFGNPVNQRGQTEYTAEGYTIDRWKLPGAHKMELADNGLKITCNASATVNHCLAQVVEGFKTGLTYTLSALIVENTTANGVNLRVGNDPGHVITGTGIFSWTFVASGATDLLNSPGMQFNSRASDGDNYFVVLAMKLELGSQQTLAHQDADGNWVLNEIPDYGEQLRRCQRYFVRLNGIAPLSVGYAYDSGSVLSVISLPVAMRTNPAVTLRGAVNYRFSGSANYQATNLLNYGFSGFSIQLFSNSFINSPTLTSGKPCDVYLTEGNYLDISADL